jgi:ornithine carbamoyltransferase
VADPAVAAAAERARRAVEAPAPPHIIRDDDLTPRAVADIFDLAQRVKAHPRRYAHALEGRYLAVIFEKRSLRTRFTFELGMKTLGGESVFMDTGTQRIPDREPICDVARNLARWVDAIALRTFSHSTVEEFARYSSVPVINGLSELFHPCQSLTDYFTLQEIAGDLRSAKLAFVGDGNNVCHSLMLMGGLTGAHVSVATPELYPPRPELVARARELAQASGATIEVGHDPQKAVADADAIYTDVWASMGFEHEAEARAQAFVPYRVTRELFAPARPDAVFMHCLPAHRAEEVTDEVIESQRSVVFDQAENRLHIAKAILMMLLAQK